MSAKWAGPKAFPNILIESLILEHEVRLSGGCRIPATSFYVSRNIIHMNDSIFFPEFLLFVELRPKIFE